MHEPNHYINDVNETIKERTPSDSQKILRNRIHRIKHRYLDNIIPQQILLLYGVPEVLVGSSDVSRMTGYSEELIYEFEMQRIETFPLPRYNYNDEPMWLLSDILGWLYDPEYRVPRS